MAYHKYEVLGLVLRSFPRGEADMVYAILSEELGLVYAKATGIRHIKSKLRFHLQAPALLNLTLVRGKEFFRIVGADNANLIWQNENRFSATRLARLYTLALRLMGEGKDEGVFAILKEATEQISSFENDNEEASTLEAIFAARLLQKLGYLSQKTVWSEALNNPVTAELIKNTHAMRLDLVEEVNSAISRSHL